MIGRNPTIAILVFLLLIVWSTSAAVERTDFLVNDDGGLTAQNDPRIAVAGGKGFAIVWVDRRNGNSDIYLQRFDVDGYPIGSNTRVNDDVNHSYQFEPAVSASLTGEYALVWKDYRNSIYPFKPDIYLQNLDSSVAPSGVNVNLTLDAPDSTKESPDVALAEWGGGVVVWADYRNRNWDIYGQLIDTDGTLIGPNFRVNTDVELAQQHAPRVAVSPLGWFVVAWYDNRLGNDDIFVQRFDSAGNPIGTNIRINSDSQGARQAFPDVATDGAGCFTVVWVDWRNGTYPANSDIYSRKYDTLMTPLTDEIRVNTDATIHTQKEPAIHADRMGNIAIVWADSTSTSWDVCGQMIDVDGVVREANFVANAEASGNQLTPDVSLDGVYRYIAWVDNRNGNWDIYASIQKYNSVSLTVEPTTLSFDLVSGQGLPQAQTVIVSHLGYNPQDFEASTGADWLTVSPASGTTPENVNVSVNSSLPGPGAYSASVTFAGAAGDSPVVVPVHLDVLGDLGDTDDTLFINSALVEPWQSAQTSIVARMVSDVNRISYPVGYDVSALSIDSVVINPALSSMVNFQSVIDGVGGLIRMEWTLADPGECFLRGETYLGEIFFTAAGIVTTTYLEAVNNDTLELLVATTDSRGTPVAVAGEITISPSTSVPQEDSGVQTLFELEQNRPNPFNSSTLISYNLPQAAKVTLEIYNVIGERVISLVTAHQPAGTYSIAWDGRLHNGKSAASGIYFYRLQAGSVAIVRRMILLK
ncbi:MAG: T9SS type A sorting domain-containing protein [Candidatus Zixiibacteriota bacterium]|nr:MAG: T9SS type A sorting domain-containing protein [candidate division Zixibacteria bacterium]